MDNIALKKIQEAELFLLLSFDKVCRENGLIYFLDSGTALGAVRHGGFIPWDDDIDVGMPRKDYERFMEIGQNCLPSNIFLQNKQTEKNYKRYAAKLRLIGTVFPEIDDLPYTHNGFFIDIFPFDYIPKVEWVAKWKVKYVVEIRHIIETFYRKSESESRSRAKRVFARVIKKLPSSWISRLEQHLLCCARRNEVKPLGRMTCYFWKMSLTKQYLFETNKMLPTKDIYFEGHKVMIMNDPDYYLRLMYGDYLKLPPEDQRVSHLVGNVVFGPITH